MMTYIDLDQWKRKEHFNFFYRMDYPQFNICMDIDVSNLLDYSKKNEISFYYSMIHAVTHVINDIEDFRYRIRDGKVVLHDLIHPSFTEMDASKNDLFRLITPDFNKDINEFIAHAKECSLHQKDYFGIERLAGRDDLIYITCIPWISFTHISHTISFNKNDSVPRISWGKYFHRNGRTMLPFSVQVHHALLDGFHVGKYVNQLQDYLNRLQ
jgi:chloramphenicol O-acetyltransferase type A